MKLLPTRSCFFVFLAAGCSLFSALPVYAATNAWFANTGLFPEQLSTNWILRDTSPSNPTLSGGHMTLSTAANSEGLFYMQTNNLSISSPVIIEFSARFGSRNTNFNWISPVSIFFTTGVSGGNGIGNILYLGQDDVWVSGPLFGQRGPGASVDTDGAFHTYHIEITSPTSAGIANQLKVFYDGGPTPIISATLSSDFNLNGTFRRFGFGDSTQGDSGLSEWQYFWHSGSSIPIGEVPEPAAGVWIAAGAFVWAGWSRRLRRRCAATTTL